MEELNSSIYLYNKFPSYFKLTSLRINIEQQNIGKCLSNHESYDDEKYELLKSKIAILNNHFEDVVSHEEFIIRTKYPLGKTGSNELVDLFKQIEGINIFEESIDLGKLDGILTKRHLIIHQDIDPQLTIGDIEGYKSYLIHLSNVVERYLESFLESVK